MFSILSFTLLIRGKSEYHFAILGKKWIFFVKNAKKAGKDGSAPGQQKPARADLVEFALYGRY
jgi:hypothetical protein